MSGPIHIGDRPVGPGQPCFVIAEIGSNHDGSLDRARELIAAAAKAGADAVKFQSFSAEGLLNPRKRDEDSGQWVAHPVFEILRRLSVPDEWHAELQAEAARNGTLFLSAPFDERKADLLQGLGVPAYKIASGDLTHLRLLRHVARFGKPIILSTGHAYLGEVEQALQTIYEAGNRQVVVLHCVSCYPSGFADANIRAMATMAQAFDVPVGYSDHTPGWTVPLGAVALGACVIEKHVTFDRALPGPDHPYAMTVGEFGEMIAQIRNLEAALGTGLKQPVAGEVGERFGARRGVFARRPIPRGEVVTEESIRVVRHCYGIHADEVDRVLGRVAQQDIAADEALEWRML